MGSCKECRYLAEENENYITCLGASKKCKELALEYMKTGRYDKAIQQSMQSQFAPQLVEAPDA